ncbi:MAG: ChaN family lipoprotein, partial [Flavobacteriales bacterium]|nr:ChaN family lipoprotein [Flavobacteriales bacterium]
MNKIPIIVFLCISTLVFSQHKKAYTIFTSSGEETVYSNLLENISSADIVLFGEQHNSAISHWLQYELTSDLTKSKNIIVGAEMFERDNQEVLNEYLAGEIDQKGLDTLARLWINYRTDYK